MKEISLNCRDVLFELSKRLSRRHVSQITTINRSEIPTVVYTSFDGDLLSYSEVMKYKVLRKNHIPLNPESALGTYIVSTHYMGKKHQ